MKKILGIAAIVMSLAGCSNSGNGASTTSDTLAAPFGDTANTGGGGLDTSSVNTGDSSGLNRDTSRTDRTDVRKTTDTSTRRRSDTLR